MYTTIGHINSNNIDSSKFSNINSNLSMVPIYPRNNMNQEDLRSQTSPASFESIKLIKDMNMRFIEDSSGELQENIVDNIPRSTVSDVQSSRCEATVPIEDMNALTMQLDKKEIANSKLEESNALDSEIKSCDNGEKSKDIIYEGADLRVIFPNINLLPNIKIDPKEPTTMTIIMKLDGNVDYRRIMDFIRIPKITQSELNNSNKTKSELPIINEPGRIITARYGERIRGYKSEKLINKRAFKHSVSMYISTGKNVLSIKLSSNTIQMCGAKSSLMAIEAVGYVLDNLKSGNKIQSMLNKNTCNSNVTIDWFLKLIRDNMLLISRGTQNNMMIDHKINHEIIDDLKYLIKHYKLMEKNDEVKNLSDFTRTIIKGNMNICSCPSTFTYVGTTCGLNIKSENKCMDKLVNLVKRLMCEPKFEQNLENVNIDILEFMIDYIDRDDHKKLSDIGIDFNQLSDFISPNLRLVSIKSEMVNINYRVDFRIRLVTLCILIENSMLPCRARYNPLYDKYVTIYFPCLSEKYMINKQELENTNEIEIENYKQKYCTLLVYETGCITQSNPTERLAQDVRRIFLSLISLMENTIKI